MIMVPGLAAAIDGDGAASAAADSRPDAAPAPAAAPCGKRDRLSSSALRAAPSLLAGVPTRIEAFLAARGFERGPWLAVGFGAGAAAWFALPVWWQWCALLCLCAAAGLAALALHADGALPHLRTALLGVALMVAAGCGTVWLKSTLAGTPGLGAAGVYRLTGRITAREEIPSRDRVRLRLAARIDGRASPVALRIALPLAQDDPRLAEGALVRMRARLVPPGPPAVPGAYDFARDAWFDGIAATGAPIGVIAVLTPAPPATAPLQRWQRMLSAHIRERLGGTPGALAAAFASGDRGGIARADDQAMRDAGLTHLLSISGLHVSAVVAMAFAVTLRLLALWPWLTLRVRLPLVAAAAGATAGVAYTLLTGAEVPTVRSCLGALLVLAALAMGRSPFSMRLLATVAVMVLLAWPEAVVSPGFQMSFGSVVAIVAVHEAAPVRRFQALRDESGPMRLLRRLAVLLLTGVVIDVALMPMALFHFHRAGVYGAWANLAAIPLTTFVSMPLIALALALDLLGLGAPAWWLAGRSLDALLAIAHLFASLPGSVTRQTGLGPLAYAAILTGELWLALWSGRVRMAGLVPIAAGLATLPFAPAPQLLVAGDGADIGIAGQGPALVTLKGGKGGYLRETMLESAGLTGETLPLKDWPGARCNRDYCAATVHGDRRATTLLIARNRNRVGVLGLLDACRKVDIVIAQRSLPPQCRPKWLAIDGGKLARSGGLAIDLDGRRIPRSAKAKAHMAGSG